MGTESSKLYGDLGCQEGETRAVFERQGKPQETVITLKDNSDMVWNWQHENKAIMLMGICQNVRRAYSA